jgi:GxxExxY protein
MNADSVSEEAGQCVTAAAINKITECILGCAFEVQRVLGCGFLEKVYENALVHELTRQGMDVQQQVPIDVWYDDKVVGQYVADLIVGRAVLVELKALQALDDIHAAQCLHYLKATGLKVGLLLNFGSARVQVRRLANNL